LTHFPNLLFQQVSYRLIEQPIWHFHTQLHKLPFRHSLATISDA
jgi:hypothetical protein